LGDCIAEQTRLPEYDPPKNGNNNGEPRNG
jgi:hypothetical protein